MDWLVLGFIAVETVLLGIAIASALARGRSLGRLQELSGAHHRDDIERRVRAAIDEAERARWEAAQIVQDLAYLADLVGVGIVRLDDRLVVDFANAAAHVFLDRQRGAMVGRPALEAFVDTRVEGIARAALETGAANGELVVRAEDGPTLLVRARRSPVSGIWLVLEDVSELRRLQRIRAEFIDNLSHELRTPLTTISLLAETAARDAESAPPRLRERISKIEVETGHLVQMVNELLDLSRIEGGGPPALLLDDVDLGHVAGGAVERLRLFAERQGLRLVLDVPEHLPTVRGDEERLGQVLLNLLHNAVKFSPNGGEIRVTVRPDPDGVVVAVADPGVGVPRADQGRIFERFYKVDRARVRGRGGGTGLGLAIARHIVESHGGRIWVESEEGAGSTFSFVQPPSPEAEVEASGRTATPAG
ncbi:MAG: sensor histidine kinase [Candidatus Limnocylindrales bacterium]